MSTRVCIYVITIKEMLLCDLLTTKDIRDIYMYICMYMYVMQGLKTLKEQTRLGSRWLQASKTEAVEVQ